MTSPVFGRPEAAHAKQLVAAVAGRPATLQKVRPYIEAMTRAVLEIGEEPQVGPLLSRI